MGLLDPTTWKSVSDGLDTLKGIVTDIKTLGLAGLVGWLIKHLAGKGPEPLEPTIGPIAPG
jgi:hypothetical protein